VTSRPLWSWLAFWSGACFAGDLAFWHSSLHLTTVSNATLLSNLAPVFIAGWLWVAHRVRFQPVFLGGMVATLGGALLLVVPNAASVGQDARLLGDALGVGSAVFYGAYQLIVKRARASQSTAEVMAWSSTVTAVLLLPLAMITPGPVVPTAAQGWLPLLGLALVAQIGGQTVIAWALAHLPPALSSVSLLVQPLTATVAAWLLFGEALRPVQFVGAALVVLGILAAKRSTESSGA
jgi:drug/metabolite transporter (DMT)-like permease